MVEFIASIKRSTSKLVISTAMRATGDGMGRIGGGSPCPAERYVSNCIKYKGLYIYIYIFAYTTVSPTKISMSDLLKVNWAEIGPTSTLTIAPVK